MNRNIGKWWNTNKYTPIPTMPKSLRKQETRKTPASLRFRKLTTEVYLGPKKNKKKKTLKVQLSINFQTKF